MAVAARRPYTTIFLHNQTFFAYAFLGLIAAAFCGCGHHCGGYRYYHARKHYIAQIPQPHTGGTPAIRERERTEQAAHQQSARLPTGATGIEHIGCQLGGIRAGLSRPGVPRNAHQPAVVPHRDYEQCQDSARPRQLPKLPDRLRLHTIQSRHRGGRLCDQAQRNTAILPKHRRRL